ncbi:MAG TPA: hypothetical protein VHC69_15960 [Polyangiaceae bacterium]|nr:hypothetical protein [Polyangiaceae bacterium]
MSKVLGAAACALAVLGQGNPASAADQTKLGAGNAAASALADRSPIVRSARSFIHGRVAALRDRALRNATNDVVENPDTCVLHRAGLDDAAKRKVLSQLKAAGLVDEADDATFPGGLTAGVFPPLVHDGSTCPKLPQSFFSAPGSAFGGHHSFPGGLSVHESFNDLVAGALGDLYRRVYGHANGEGFPEIAPSSSSSAPAGANFFIDEDVLVGAPLWHDWAKAIVFQWNADGTEFAELAFGGNGRTDDAGAVGNSKTGAHHILGLAEAMKRALPPDFVIAQAAAHASPTSGNEYKVVNWIRAAALLARVDPVGRGYLRYDARRVPRLAAVRALGSVDLNAAAATLPNVLVEYVVHSISDADGAFTAPAMAEAQTLLARLAAKFGYDPADTARYNTKFRNPALSYLTAERLVVLYSSGGLAAVEAELTKLRKLGVL